MAAKRRPPRERASSGAMATYLGKAEEHIQKALDALEAIDFDSRIEKIIDRLGPPLERIQDLRDTADEQLDREDQIDD